MEVMMQLFIITHSENNRLFLITDYSQHVVLTGMYLLCERDIQRYYLARFSTKFIQQRFFKPLISMHPVIICMFIEHLYIVRSLRI